MLSPLRSQDRNAYRDVGRLTEARKSVPVPYRVAEGLPQDRLPPSFLITIAHVMYFVIGWQLILTRRCGYVRTKKGPPLPPMRFDFGHAAQSLVFGTVQYSLLADGESLSEDESRLAPSSMSCRRPACTVP